jgi:tetratricopeptide (TPR) repeat protein
MGDLERKTAFEALASGHFAEAADQFGKLIRLDPENRELECGFYASTYWSHRADLIFTDRQGRKSGNELIAEWDAFERIAEQKGYTGTESLRTLMRIVLGTAAEHFRAAFQTEGASESDTNILIDISKCMMRIQDFGNSIEVLRYAVRLSPSDPSLLFLLGETSLRSGDAEFVERGAATIRDAMLIEPNIGATQTIESSLARGALEDALRFREDGRVAQEWFPAFFMLRTFRLGGKRAEDRDTTQAEYESERLSADLQRVREEYRDRVRARICFYALVLIQRSLHPRKDVDAVRKYERLIEQADGNFFGLYREAAGR